MISNDPLGRQAGEQVALDEFNPRGDLQPLGVVGGHGQRRGADVEGRQPRFGSLACDGNRHDATAGPHVGDGDGFGAAKPPFMWSKTAITRNSSQAAGSARRT